MLVSEAIEILKTKFEEIYDEDEFNVFGLRFEDKERQEGETCENSRNNTDRDDERDFPEFGSAEYTEMDEMDGTSAWHEDHILAELARENGEMKSFNRAKHAYIIGGQSTGWEQLNGEIDDGELVIQEAKVLYVLY